MNENSLNVRGFVTLYDIGDRILKDVGNGKMGVQFVKGRILWAEKNIIVTLGRKRVAELLTGLSTDFVNQMAIGDGGAPQTDLLVPIVPVLSDTALVHELARTSVVNPVVNGQEATFLSTFLTTSLSDPDFIDPANKVINEAGLFCVDDIMFARKTFPSVPFSPADRVGVIAEWKIEVL